MTCRAPIEAAQHEKGGSVKVYTERPADLPAGYKHLQVPCQQCASCRLEKSRQWATRMAHEMAYWWEKHRLPSIFVTLTYNDEHLPLYGSLVKDDIQKFFKRLWWKVETDKLRYYVVGEYGATCPYHELENCPKCGPLQRPHYHAIIFGWPETPSNEDVLGHRDGINIYRSDIIENAWKEAGENGKEIIGSHEYSIASFGAAAYCARYIMKKITGDMAHDHYQKHIWQTDQLVHLVPEFAMMSKNPGIGKYYLDQYIYDIYPADECSIPGRGIHIAKPPKYYDKFWEELDPDSMEQIKRERRRAMAQSLVDGPSLESRAKVEDAKLAMYTRS